MNLDHRILYISSQFPNPLDSHAGIFSLERVLALHNVGCEVQVVCPIGLKPPLGHLLHPVRVGQRIRKMINVPKRSSIKGIQVLYPKWAWLPQPVIGWYGSLWLYWQIRHSIQEYIDEFKPDVIISSWLPDSVAACNLGEKIGIPTMVIAEGSDVNQFPRRYRGWKYARNLLNKKAAVLVFVSGALRNAGQSIGLYGQKTVVLHNAVDTDLFCSDSSGQAGGAFTILGVGNLVPIKGFSVLIQAFANIYQQLGRQARLVLVGKGSLHDVLVKQAADLGISSAIELVGAVNHETLVAFYQKADVFCLPSFSEGFPCVVIEAMACGKPVVASNVGGVGEVVDDQSGILVTPGDVEALSNAILHAKNRNWDAEGIRSKIVAGYTWPLWTSSVLDLIDSVIM